MLKSKKSSKNKRKMCIFNDGFIISRKLIPISPTKNRSKRGPAKLRFVGKRRNRARPKLKEALLVSASFS